MPISMPAPITAPTEFTKYIFGDKTVWAALVSSVTMQDGELHLTFEKMQKQVVHQNVQSIRLRHRNISVKPGDYYIVYSNGNDTATPQSVFESYAQLVVPNHSSSFSMALSAMQNGGKVRRKSWPSQHLYAALKVPEYGFSDVRYNHDEKTSFSESSIEIFYLQAQDFTFFYHPSASDLLAYDWEVVG